jgi:hypothetical protein
MARPTTRAGRKTGNTVGRPKKENALTGKIQFRTTQENEDWANSLPNKSAFFNAIIEQARKM